MDVWNNSTVQNVGHRAWGTLGDFQKFILRGNVVDLAVGIMIGAGFSSVVNALVSDVLTPLIPGNGKNGLDALTIPVFYTGSTIKLGAFINAAISFVILAFVIYFFVVKPVNALTTRFSPKAPAEPSTRECPYCLSKIPLKATRCAFCTAQLPPADTTPATGRASGA